MLIIFDMIVQSFHEHRQCCVRSDITVERRVFITVGGSVHYSRKKSVPVTNQGWNKLLEKAVGSTEQKLLRLRVVQ